MDQGMQQDGGSLVMERKESEAAVDITGNLLD